MITNDNHDLKKNKKKTGNSQTGRGKKRKKKEEELVLPVAFDCSVGWRTLKRN